MKRVLIALLFGCGAPCEVPTPPTAYCSCVVVSQGGGLADTDECTLTLCVDNVGETYLQLPDGGTRR